MREHADWEICAEVENGQLAVEKAREAKPDVVVLDLAMPVLDGLSAASVIRRLLPKVPIVLVTLFYFKHLEVLAAACGVQFVVAKSEAPTQPPAAIEECLKNSPPATAANETVRVGAAAAGATSATASKVTAADGTPHEKKTTAEESRVALIKRKDRSSIWPLV